MALIGGIDRGDSTTARPDSTAVDFSAARTAYLEAVSPPLERHVEVGVLSPCGL